MALDHPVDGRAARIALRLLCSGTSEERRATQHLALGTSQAVRSLLGPRDHISLDVKPQRFRMLLLVCYRLIVEQDFDLLTEIVAIEVIAIGRSIRDLRRLVESYGDGRWRKLKGVATVRLHSNGRVRRAELHWYEAHGIGKRDLKIKRYVD